MEGISFGASGDVCGEIVFYNRHDRLSGDFDRPQLPWPDRGADLSLIGNYGVIPADFESTRPQVRAYVVRQWCQEPSNFRSEGDLDAYLKEQGIVGLWGIDTRQLTKRIRQNGVMNGKIVREIRDLPALLDEIRSYRIQGAVEAVTCPSPRTDTPEEPRRRVVLWDFGAKENIRREPLRAGL